jgi:hypothetical protein
MPRKRHKKKKSSTLQDLMQEMQANKGLKGFKTLINPPGEIKMSDAITELLKPYSDLGDDLSSHTNLVALACVAWNIANMPEKERFREIQHALNQLPDTDSELRMDMTGFMAELIERKELLFPDNQRYIVDFKVTEAKKDYHIAIASTLPADK